MTLSSISAFFLGFALTQIVIFLVVAFYNCSKKPKHTTVVKDVVESEVEKIARLLSFNPYEYTTITKLYNRLDGIIKLLPKTHPKAVKILHKVINDDAVPGGERVASTYPPAILLSIIDTSTTSLRREHLIRKYTKE